MRFIKCTYALTPRVLLVIAAEFHIFLINTSTIATSFDNCLIGIKLRSSPGQPITKARASPALCSCAITSSSVIVLFYAYHMNFS